MVTKETLGNNIKLYMEKKGLQQKELAKKINITPAKMSNYITGKSFPAVDVLAAIAEALEVSTDMLIYGEEAQNNAQIRTWGDVARALFQMEELLNTPFVDGFRISIQNENYETGKIDTSTGMPDFDTRARPYITFGQPGTWDIGEAEFNKTLCDWNNFQVVVQNLDEETRESLLQAWKSGVLKNLDKRYIVAAPYLPLEYDELPF